MMLYYLSITLLMGILINNHALTEAARASGQWLVSVESCNMPGLTQVQSEDSFLNAVTDKSYFPDIQGAIPAEVDCTYRMRRIWGKAGGGFNFITNPWIVSEDISGDSSSGNAAAAFDVNIGSRFHSALEETPWVSGDLQQIYTIIGARFTARGDGYAGRTKNLHFLVSVEASGLDDYDSSIVYVYPGPALIAAQVEWLPCLPFRQAQHVKVMMILTPTTKEYLNFQSLDIYGY